MVPLLDKDKKKRKVAREAVIHRLKTLGATSPDLGVFLPSLDLDEISNEIFLDLLRRGVILETETGRYHLSHPSLGSIPAGRRVQIAFWVSLTIIYAVITVLALLSL